MWQNSTNGNQEAGPIQEDISFLLPGGELRGRKSLGDLCRDIARGPREAPTEHLGGGESLTVPWEAAAGTVTQSFALPSILLHLTALNLLPWDCPF